MLLCLLLLYCSGGLLYGQAEPIPATVTPEGIIPCASHEAREKLRLQNPNLESPEEFERWLAPLKEAMAKGESRSTGCNGIPDIGVVFHIIHSGEPIGTDPNVDANLINAQLSQMNIDFAGFINFCPAGVQEDGNAMAELGINRVNRLTMGWPADIFQICELINGGPRIEIDVSKIEDIIKPATQWDPERYLNVWIIPMECTEDIRLLGYAQFPLSSGLMGIPTETPMGADSDGIVLLPGTLGSLNQQNPNPVSAESGYGVTMAHEVGHFLGLIHVWGDGNGLTGCDVDDFCEDTPLSLLDNRVCQLVRSCSVDEYDMVENYMNYTGDLCRDTFTPCQHLRMQTVLANSPRRMNLCTSGSCCVETVTLKFRTEDFNGIPRKDFCEGDKVYLDAVATTGEMDYALEIYNRPIGGGSAYSLVYDFGWVNTPIPDQIDLGDRLASVGVAMKGGFEYRINISTNGTCGVIQKHKRFRYLPNNQNVLVEIQDANANPQTSFCVGETVWVDPTGNEDISTYRYRILRQLTGDPNINLYFATVIFNEAPSVFDLTDLLGQAGLSLEAGYDYTVALDAWGQCFGPITGTASFTVENCLPSCEPPENLRCEQWGETKRLAWNPVNGASSYDLLISVNAPSCGCSLGALEDRFPTVNTAYYELPSDLVNACFSWQIKTNCGLLESPQYSASACYAPDQHCDIIGVEQMGWDQVLPHDLTIYPNPSNGNIVVEWQAKVPTEIQLRIFDLKGRVVYQSEKNELPQGPFQHTLHLEHRLDAGLYFLQLQSPQGIDQQKIMIVK